MGMTKAEIYALRRKYHEVVADIEDQIEQCEQLASSGRLAVLADLRAERREIKMKLAAAGVPLKE
jgi:hypothetical protein